MKRILSVVLMITLLMSVFSMNTVFAAATTSSYTGNPRFGQKVYDMMIYQPYSTNIKFTDEELSEIEYQMYHEKNNVEVVIAFDITAEKIDTISNITLPKSVLQAAKINNRYIKFTIQPTDRFFAYSWTIIGSNVDKLYDINLALKATEISKIQIQDTVSVNSAAIQLKHTGDLPANTCLVVYMGDAFYNLIAQQENYYYLYKMTSRKLSYHGTGFYKFDQNCCVTFSTSKGGDFVLTPTYLSFQNNNSSNSNKPSTITLNTSSINIREGSQGSFIVKQPRRNDFSVSTSNSSIVTVDSSTSTSDGMKYTLTGVSSGTASITIESPDGGKTTLPVMVTETKGSVMIDTLAYNLAPNNVYGYKIVLDGASANEVVTTSSRPHIASVREISRMQKNGKTEVYYEIRGLRASGDPVTVSSSVRGTHNSIKVMVTQGIRQYGVSARHYSYF